MSVADQIAARVAALSADHHLSKARAEGVALALEDAAERGEWPPRAMASVTIDAAESTRRLVEEVKAAEARAVNKRAAAACVAEALRALHVPVTGEMDLAIQRALGG